MAWLVVDGAVIASAEVAATRRARRTGLRGRDHLEGALVLKPCRSVHTFGVAFPIDVAFCDDTGRVLRTSTMPPRRLSRFVRRSAFVVEARRGSLSRWGISEGVEVEVRATADE